MNINDDDNNGGGKLPAKPPKPPFPSDKSKWPKFDGWQTAVYKKPRWITSGNDDGHWSWFWYFKTDNSQETSEIPPPPSSFLDDSSDDGTDDELDDEKEKNRVSRIRITKFFAHPPKLNSSSQQFGLSVTVEDGDEDNENNGDNDEDIPITAKVFSTEGLSRPELREKAIELGIYEEGDKKPALKRKIDEYWMRACEEAGNIQDYFRADCFQNQKQDISRKRKESKGKKRKNDQEKKIDDGDVQEKKKTNTKKKPLNPEDVLKEFPNEGFYLRSDGFMSCGCNNKKIKVWDRAMYDRHCRQVGHTNWKEKNETTGVQQAHLRRLTERENETRRLQFAGTRSSNSLTPDIIVDREDYLKSMMMAGIPLYSGEKIRPWIERRMSTSIGPRTDLVRDHLPKLLNDEINEQNEELRGKEVGIIFDATPRLGEVFALLVRFIHLDSKKKTAVAKQLLIYFSALKHSLDASSLCTEIFTATGSRNLALQDVRVSMNDGCSVNIAAHNRIKHSCTTTNTIPWLVAYCLSHCCSNGGKEANFVLLDLFWSLLLKVFANSNKAKNLWKDRTGKNFPSHNEIRWYSKYEVLEELAKKFQFLMSTVQAAVDEGVSKKNAAKLLLLLLDEKKSRQLKIELAAYTEALFILRNLCYFLEGDGTDLPFKAGRRIDELRDVFQNDTNIGNLPSTRRLIMEAIDWAGENGLIQPTNPPARRTVRQIDAQLTAQRPRRRAAIEGVRNAVRAGETAVQRRNRERTEQLQRDIVEANEQEQFEEARTAELESEVNGQTRDFLLTVNDWNAHLVTGIAPAITYITSRFFLENGDRYQNVLFYRGASIFDPSYAKNIPAHEANDLIDLMSCYPVLSRTRIGVESDTLIGRLKKGFKSYRQNAMLVVPGFGKDSNGNDIDGSILTWHYRLYLRIDDDRKADKKKSKCRYCPNTNNNCKCDHNLKAWFEAACLVALVMPSSAAAERVFSLLRNLISEQQNRCLEDYIFLSLALSTNKRPV